jgi:hypothetical protein
MGWGAKKLWSKNKAMLVKRHEISRNQLKQARNQPKQAPNHPQISPNWRGKMGVQMPEKIIQAIENKRINYDERAPTQAQIGRVLANFGELRSN